MRARVDLHLQASERKALRALDADERQAVIDELLVQVREDLEWVMARAAVTSDEPPPLPRELGPLQNASLRNRLHARR